MKNLSLLRENFRERREAVTPPFFRSKFPSCIRVVCLSRKIIAIKKSITSRQSIRSDSGFTRVKAILELYIWRCERKIEKVKTGEKEPKSRSRRRSTFERQRKKKKRKSIKRPRRTPGTTTSSSSSERVPSITVVRRLPFLYTQ